MSRAWSSTSSGKSPAYSIRNWEELVSKAKAPLIMSGILELTVRLFRRLATMTGVPLAELIEHVTGNDQAGTSSETRRTLSCRLTIGIEM